MTRFFLVCRCARQVIAVTRQGETNKLYNWTYKHGNDKTVKQESEETRLYKGQLNAMKRITALSRETSQSSKVSHRSRTQRTEAVEHTNHAIVSGATRCIHLEATNANVASYPAARLSSRPSCPFLLSPSALFLRVTRNTELQENKEELSKLFSSMGSRLGTCSPRLQLWEVRRRKITVDLTPKLARWDEVRWPIPSKKQKGRTIRTKLKKKQTTSSGVDKQKRKETGGHAKSKNRTNHASEQTTQAKQRRADAHYRIVGAQAKSSTPQAIFFMDIFFLFRRARQVNRSRQSKKIELENARVAKGDQRESSEKRAEKLRQRKSSTKKTTKNKTKQKPKTPTKQRCLRYVQGPSQGRIHSVAKLHDSTVTSLIDRSHIINVPKG